MKTSILKRLETLETLADRASARPLVLIDATKLPDVDRDAYWAGDDAVLNRHGARDGAEASPGLIHTLVISIHPEMRDAWLSTDEVDDEALEKLERQHEAEERRRAAEDRQQAYQALLAAGTPRLPPAPANAYSPVHGEDD